MQHTRRLRQIDRYARAWINGLPAPQPPHDVRLYPNVLFQHMPRVCPTPGRPPGATAVCVCANGVVLCDPGGRRCLAFPRLYSDALREAVRRAVLAVARAAHAEAKRSRAEVGGDLLAQRQGSQWDVVAIMCLNRNSTELRSDPACRGNRRCDNADPRRENRVPVPESRRPRPWRRGSRAGEFHTHPEHNPRHIKPGSDSDFYRPGARRGEAPAPQLLLSPRPAGGLTSALNEYHGCSVVIAMEGVYFYATTPRALHRFRADVERYLVDHGYSDEARAVALSECQQPVPEKVTKGRHPYLRRLLVRLRVSYRKLMQGCQGRCKVHLSSQYHRRVRHLGITSQFELWQRHPSTWSHAKDARIQVTSVTM